MISLLVSGIHPAELKVKVKTSSAGGARATGHNQLVEQGHGAPGPSECCEGGGGRTREGCGVQGKESSVADGYGEIRERWPTCHRHPQGQFQCGQGPAQRVSWPWTYRRSRGFPGGSEGKASAYNSGDPGLIPGSGRSPGEGNGNPLQYSCLGNPKD